MTTFFLKLVLTVGFVLALALTFSCSSDDHKEQRTVKKEKVTGISQKGPFVKGAKVTIYELDANLEKTKNSFDGEIIDDNGNFEVELTSEKLASPYIILEVKGKYTNEVTGELSNAAITLNAVADISGKNNVNINVLTHLEFEKVLKLAKSDNDFAGAKKQAQKEVLNALDISESGFKNSEDISLFGGSPNDSMLLAVSKLLQGNRSAGEVSDLLAKFGDEIRDYGTVSDSIINEIKQPPVATPSSSSLAPSSSSSLAPSSSSSFELSSSSLTPSSSSSLALPSSSSIVNTFIDKRDNNTYRFVEIGKQTWMAQNLNYNIQGAECDNSYCKTYGMLYNYGIAELACPTGWHLPSDAEWDTLINFVGNGDDQIAGKYLKAMSGWVDPGNGGSGNGLDNYGFAALPGGYIDPAGDSTSVSHRGHWWSAKESNANYAYCRYITYEDDNVYKEEDDSSDYSYSIRCIKD